MQPKNRVAILKVLNSYARSPQLSLWHVGRSGAGCVQRRCSDGPCASLIVLPGIGGGPEKQACCFLVYAFVKSFSQRERATRGIRGSAAWAVPRGRFLQSLLQIHNAEDIARPLSWASWTLWMCYSEILFSCDYTFGISLKCWSSHFSHFSFFSAVGRSGPFPEIY